MSTTSLPTPYSIYEDSRVKVLLDHLSRDEIEKAFRIRFLDRPDGSYIPTLMNSQDYVHDNNIFHFLHESNVQIRALPKKSNGVNKDFKDSIALALNCVLGVSDNFTSWQYDTHSTVKEAFEYKNYRSQSITQDISAENISDLQKVIAFEPSEYLPEHKLKTLKALLYSASHQGTSIDVSCGLYISILEAIFVQDDSELSYKLSMRIAASMGEDLLYAKNIKRLYALRGKVIHGSSKGNVFTLDQNKELEIFAKQSFLKLLNNPKMLTSDELDKSLLN